MPDYKQLYFELFSRVSDVIEELQKIQLESEEKYISDENNNSEDMNL